MDNVEQILLKMLPGKEERDTYTVFYLQSKWKSICGENVARHFQACEAGKQSFIYQYRQFRMVKSSAFNEKAVFKKY